MLSSTGLRNNSATYGRGTHEIEDEPDDVLSEEATLTTWLDGFFQKPTVELPRLPTVANDIIALSRRADVKIEDVAKLLEREPLLAGKVLRLSNSTLYGATTPCTTLKSALVRIGLTLVRDVVMEAAFHMTVIHAPGFSDTLESVRRHSTAVAYLARFVARNTAIDAENAFLVGLLHDVGSSVGLLGLSEYLKAHKRKPELTAARWQAVERLHATVTGRLLASWGMPAGVTLVAQHHHQLVIGGMAHPGVAVMRIAEALAHDGGWDLTPVVVQRLGDLPVEPTERVSADETDTALKVLGLTPRHYETIKKDTQRVLETLAAEYKPGR